MKRQDKIKLWVDIWLKAQEDLNKIRVKELKQFNYQKDKKIINDMIELGLKFSKEKKYSGLVDQQRYFMKMRK